MASSTQQQQSTSTANRDVRKELGSYIFGKTLGQGTFGKVKLATHKATGEMVAVKILEKDKILDVADVERVSREIHILKLVRHPNIIQLYEIIETPKQLFLVMEYVENGELFHYIVRHKRLPEEQACRMYHELVSGIEYIHKLTIAHRDLKPENLLLDFNHSLKLVDFGLSNTYRKDESLKTPCGSPCYAAPEMIKGERYNGLRVDIWSSGVILFAMLCGCLPFEDNDTNKLYKKILSGKYILPSGISQPAKDLLSKVLTIDPEKRITIEEIRQHEWMCGRNIVTNPGLIVGYNRIPVDKKIIDQTAETLNIQPDYAVKCVQANRHNNVTTAYYLMFKKFIKNGGSSTADMSSSTFDRSQTQPNKRSEANSKHKYFVVDHNKENRETANRASKDISKLTNLQIAIPTRKKEVEMSSKYSSTRPQQSTRKSISKEKSRGELWQRSTIIVLDRKKKLPFGQHQLSSKELQPSQPKQRHPVSVTSQQSRLNKHYREEFNKSLVSRSREKDRSSVAYVPQRMRVVSTHSTQQRADASVSRERAVSNNQSQHRVTLNNASRISSDYAGEDARKAINMSMELKRHKRNRSTQLRKPLNESFNGVRNGEHHYKKPR